MRFRRGVSEGVQWVAVAQEGASVHAAQVCHVEGQRPKVQWLWNTESEQLPEALNQLKRAHPLGERPLVYQMDRAQYRLLSTEVPDVPREEWRDAMRWRLKDQVDFPMDDALLEVLAVPQDTQLRQMYPAIALVTQRSDFEHLALAADDAGLSWSAMDTPETALRNLSAMAEVEGQAHALLVFGESHGMLVITYQGELLMTRNIEVAVSAVTGSNEARGAALGRAALEVLRTLDTFERMHSQATLSGLSVVPPQGGEADVIEVLADLVYVPIKYFALADCVDLSPLGERAEQLAKGLGLKELCVIGSALRAHSESQGRQSVNLMAPGEQPSRRAAWGAVWGVAAAGAVLGVALLIGAGFAIANSVAQFQISRLEQEMAELRQSATVIPPMTEVKELATLRKTEARQRQMHDALQSTVSAAGPGYSEYLQALARQTQGTLWVTGLVLRDQGRDLELVGRMTDATALPRYLSRLQEEERFRGRRFAQMELRAVNLGELGGGPAITEFSLRSREAGAKPAGEAPLDPDLKHLSERR